MKIKELIEKLQKLNNQDLEVCVRVTKTMSPYTGEQVTNIYNGFDWEQGKLMLCTKSDLIRMHDTCKHCEMYGIKHAKDISTRVLWVDMNKGDMEVAVFLGKEKKFSVPFNVRAIE